MNLLDSQLKKAEQRFQGMKSNLTDRKDNESRLDELMKKLSILQQKLKGKDDQILELEEELSLARAGNNLKEGWLYKKGSTLGIWYVL